MTTYTQAMVDVSVALEQQRSERLNVEARIEALITDGRNLNMTWAMIGSALHVSAQSAWERYGLTPEEKAARSRQNQPAVEQDTLLGLEETREDRIAARKIVLEKKRAKKPKKD